MLNFSRDIANIGPDPIFMIGNFKIVNSTLMILLIVILFILTYIFIVRKFSERPNKSQGFIEVLYESIISFVDQITGNTSKSEAIIPIITTLFVFLGISNLIGLVPGLTSITIGEASLFRSPTADLNLTFTLALGSVVAIQIASVKKNGFLKHVDQYLRFGHVFKSFKQGVKKGVMSIIDFGIGILDIIGEIAKVVSLSLRLFGNIYAGEVLAVILIGAFAWFVPATWTAMNVLVGVIQALVFGSLVTAYYTLATSNDE
jgi:F-type H+-transporting ATPase subunit a